VIKEVIRGVKKCGSGFPANLKPPVVPLIRGTLSVPPLIRGG